MRILFALLLAGCANPKYVTPSDVATTSSAGETAIDFKPGPGRVALRWETKATTDQYGTFLLKIGRANIGDGSLLPEDVSGLNVFLWMPSMTPPHGSVPVEIERVDVGTYRVSHVLFIMAGGWEIHVQLRDGSAVRNEAILPFSL